MLTMERTVPEIDLATWRLTVAGLVERPLSLSWMELLALPRRTLRVDIHCVTRWSRLDVPWTGVPLSDLADAARVELSARHVLARSVTGYTTSLSADDVMRPGTLAAYEVDGEPLPPEHGGPVRLVIPHLYLWKSAKWLSGLEFLDREQSGYWEERGYHRTGRPWLEERFEL